MISYWEITTIVRNVLVHTSILYVRCFISNLDKIYSISYTQVKSTV